jgi:hypothetical protein
MFGFVRSQFINFYLFIKALFFLILLMFSKCVDFFNSEFSALDQKRNLIFSDDVLKYAFYNTNDLKKNMFSILFAKKSFFYIDLLAILISSLKYSSTMSKTSLFRSYFRVLNTKQGFYFNFNLLKNNKTFVDSLKNLFLSGFKSI